MLPHKKGTSLKKAWHVSQVEGVFGSAFGCISFRVPRSARTVARGDDGELACAPADIGISEGTDVWCVCFEAWHPFWGFEGNGKAATTIEMSKLLWHTSVSVFLVTRLRRYTCQRYICRLAIVLASKKTCGCHCTGPYASFVLFLISLGSGRQKVTKARLSSTGHLPMPGCTGKLPRSNAG